jgi:hypothetical protein
MVIITFKAAVGLFGGAWKELYGGFSRGKRICMFFFDLEQFRKSLNKNEKEEIS